MDLSSFRTEPRLGLHEAEMWEERCKTVAPIVLRVDEIGWEECESGRYLESCVEVMEHIGDDRVSRSLLHT
jgi:hypothetical protein